MAVKPLEPTDLYKACDPDQFTFKTTDDLPVLDEVVGQDRAVEALRFAVGMRHEGYNLFALGPGGTGKYSLVRRYLVEAATEKPVPGDWCYVNNFTESHKPFALKLPPGRARPFCEDMKRLIDDLGGAIPAAFEGEDYRHRKEAIEEEFKARHEEAFGGLNKRAQEHDVALIRTPVGLALTAVKDGEVLSSKEFEELSDEEQKSRKETIEEMQSELEEMLGDIPKWTKEQHQRIKDLNRKVTMHAVGHLIDTLKKSWEDQPGVLDHLEAVRQDVVENAADFLAEDQQATDSPFASAERQALSGAASFRRYQVNVLVDHYVRVSGPETAEKETDADNLAGPSCTLDGAPIIYEDHPTQPRLIGRIEHLSQFGSLVTDFNLIKAGALHLANGGYLILDVHKVLMQPMAWETLKRALRSRQIRIETPAEAMGWSSTVTLEPEPIPLDVKVVLIGEPHLYYLLTHYDPDFRELFKVAADFDNRMNRDGEAIQQLGQLIGTLARREHLKPLDRGAIARIIEFGSREAGDAEKLTTHMGTIVDLVREADYWAGEAKSKAIKADHIQIAIDTKTRRSDRMRERILEEIDRGTIVIETKGEAMGQVNGLAVIQLDGFSFGRPSRISCRARLGKGEVVDIEREVMLGGPLHSKGVMILSAFLSSRFAREKPLSLSASLVFEQSYGGVDGDSASSAELYALMSALSGYPIRQALAVTGSVDQNGRVQAIGGVNEKIEGFFDVCQARGLSGDQGVLIPATNVKHLMLRSDVVAAAAAGQFHIYPVETIDQGIEVLTGLEAGAADAKGGYPLGSVNRAVAKRLDDFAKKARAAGKKDKPRRPANRNKNDKS